MYNLRLNTDHHWTSLTDIQYSKSNSKSKDLNSVIFTLADKNTLDCMQEKFKFPNHSSLKISQVWCEIIKAWFQKQDHFLKTESYGADHQHLLKEMVCSTSTLLTLTPDSSTQCSSSVSCTDGGDMPLTVCTKPNINSTMNYQKICTTNWTLVYHQFQRSGSDLVDLQTILIISFPLVFL